MFGTGTAGLNVRAGSNTHAAILDVIPEGTTVGIGCQDEGELVFSGGGQTAIWNFLPAYQGFVSDAYTITGYDGRIPGVPTCDGSVIEEGGPTIQNDPPVSGVGDDYVEETELNDKREDANSINGSAGAQGSIHPATDKDYYWFKVSDNARLTVSTSRPGGGACGDDHDTEIRVLSQTGTEIAMNDDDPSSGDRCSFVDFNADTDLGNMKAGTYYVYVKRHAEQEEIEAYKLDVRVEYEKDE